MGVEWVSVIYENVFRRIQSDFSPSIMKTQKMDKYTNFSNVGSSDTPAAFPFVYVQSLPFDERGQDLDGETINAGLFSFQIDVTDNKNRKNVQQVSLEIMRIMKSMRFEAVTALAYEDAKGVYRTTSRYQRVIGEGDLL